MRESMAKLEKYLPLIKIILTLALLIVGLVAPLNEVSELIVFIAALIIIGYEPFWECCKTLVKFRFDENLLMIIAAVGAFILGQYAEGIAVLLLKTVGEMFEEYAVDKSRSSITRIAEMRSPYARVERNGEYIETDPESVVRGEKLLIKPGERVPVDCVICEGESALDVSALTGESAPINVAAGDAVLSGSIVLNGALTAYCEREYRDGTVARILEMVESGKAKKAVTEKFITKFARIYTPVVVAAAILIALIPSLITGNYSEWIYIALNFLVISCPCALVISVPLAFFRGIGIASGKGILIKGSHYMEELSKIQAVAFDKTGTLTEGRFVIEKINPYKIDEKEFMQKARIAECDSNHPLAKAIVGENYNGARPDVFEERGGKGVVAKYGENSYLAGNAAFLASNGVEIERSEGGSVVYFAENGRYIGSIVLRDAIRKEAETVSEKLAAVGINRTVILSGDAEKECKRVAENLGFCEYHGELLPADKALYFEELKKGGVKAAFVGDGINDAPSIASADVGIAMGDNGSDAAVESADVVLMKNDPSLVADGVKISRRTMRIARENIIFSIAVKVAVMALSLAGIASMFLAIFADVGVSFIAILNAVRPMKKEREKIARKK